MIGFLVVVITLLALAGLIRATDRVDDRPRITTTLPQAQPPFRPFRTSEDQCVECGQDDGPLSIDDGRCFWCFEKARG